MRAVTCAGVGPESVPSIATHIVVDVDVLFRFLHVDYFGTISNALLSKRPGAVT
jgi:hypothetical protein